LVGNPQVGKVSFRKFGEWAGLDHGNLVEALSAASELEHVGLAEALALLLLIAEHEPAKFERAALRWHARFCREAKDIPPGEALAVLALLGLLCGTRAKPAARALSEVRYRRGTEPSCEVLVRWASQGGPS
jgi:hypothetical protein